MRNPQVYVLALIAKGDISLHAWLKIANQNGQCRTMFSCIFNLCDVRMRRSIACFASRGYLRGPPEKRSRFLGIVLSGESR